MSSTDDRTRATGAQSLALAATVDGTFAGREPGGPGAIKVSFAAPRQVGRFLLLRMLGSGGMGAVYAAFDERLDRRVAIKLLHQTERQSELQRERVLREAQAMARVSHANVVPIYEVGEVDEQIFITMEYVEGTTLKEWQRSKQRPWQEVLRMYLEAGAGLRAAHEAGLIHRDFKADNVLIGREGRPRVADFGLARLGAGGSSAAEKDPSGPSGERLATPLTVAGAVSGTPGYMSPEQYLAKEVDARSDQWSFCASLYEALYGRLPFEGSSFAELAANTLAGKLSPRPAGAFVPIEVHAALARGLATEPDQRFVSMDALMAALALEQGHTAAGVSATRRRALNLFVAFILVLHVCARVLAPSAGPPPYNSALTSAAGLVVFSVIGLVLRRTWLRNTFHRRIYTLCAVTLVQKTLLALFATYFALPHPVFFAIDLLCLTGATTLGAFLGLPVLFWLSPVMLAGACLTARYGAAIVPFAFSLYPIAVGTITLAWSAAAERAQRESLQAPPSH